MSDGISALAVAAASDDAATHRDPLGRGPRRGAAGGRPSGAVVRLGRPRGACAVQLHDWMAGIAADVAATGATKRGVARGLSLGVNAGAVTIMLGAFMATGGVTGAEVGIAAATAFLNQKLMNALFGEAAVQEMIDHAREDLAARLRDLLDGERAASTDWRAAPSVRSRSSSGEPPEEDGPERPAPRPSRPTCSPGSMRRSRRRARWGLG
ncbi:MAG: hypothetical protein R3C32_12660 [Chloroflexota bacterium]